eukprot:4944743-Pyramimonas_sp.AAC.1
MINLLSITQGKEDLESIKRGLMKMDVRKKGSQARKQKVYAVDQSDDEDGSADAVIYYEFEQDIIMDDADAAAFYEAIESQELDEDQAVAVLAAVLDEKRATSGKPRKWAESRELKKAIARDRDFFDSKRSGGKPAPRPGTGRRRLSVI